MASVDCDCLRIHGMALCTGGGCRNAAPADERCDKCGAPKSQWATSSCVKSLTQSPRHSITRLIVR